ncbi:hypothetical protein RHMOL_Rhmol04G0040300 [Rhododendron molle]|uniref:Uncharacterized protein n=1 Tax=Rhododendron molle TaxID=49168 RepID=A0ACC0NXY1_RHOML|nr:hypothetical protein RHMOL_Rhmol04G0040300 [Rhododendron molle]
MGQRNMMCPNQMIDMELDQQAQSNVHPEPCVLFGTSIPNFPQPNVHTMLPAAGNAANFDIHHLPDNHENAVFYGMSQYNGFQHHPSRNLDLGVATASHYFNPYMTPPGTRVFPLSINQGSHIQLPSSSSGIGVPTDDYRRNDHFIDGGFPFKRKNDEGVPPSFQYCNASAGSSSGVAPLNPRPFEPGVTLMDVAPFPLPEYRGNDIPSVMEVRSQRNARNISGLELIMTRSLSLSLSLSLSEPGNMGAQGYQETNSGGSSTNFLHPPMHQGHPSLYQPSQPMQGLRGQSVNFHSQLATPSHRPSTNTTSHASMNPFQDCVELGPRYVAPAPPTGLRIHRPHRRALMSDATTRHRDLPHLRVLHTDEVAMLEIPGYHELGHPTDHHRDMRLDIDHMSYEELLALGEQIGHVTTGLSEETILSHLKTRTYMNLEEATCTDEETDFCVVCQTDYKNQEKVGTLDCGHEYHVDCVKRWLLIKNTCPICKAAALSTERKDLRREGR